MLLLSLKGFSEQQMCRTWWYGCAMIRVFRTRTFTRWMRRIGLTDEALCEAVSEMIVGLIERVELKALRSLARDLLQLNERQLEIAVRVGEIVEVCCGKCTAH
jgi:hypothetical protein